MADPVPYSGNGTPPQAREATTVQSSSPSRSPIVYREGPPLYVADVDVTLPDDMDPAELTWNDWHGDSDLYACAYGAVVEVDDCTFDRCRFTRLGDGVSITGQRPVIRHCWFEDLYDDAIELDHKWSATIEGCVLDGVHVGFSSRSSIEREPGEVVTITDTMVRLRPQYHSYKPDTYGHDQHGPFFKWDPEVAVHLDQVWLYAEQESAYGGCLGPPPVCTGTTVHLCGTGTWSSEAMAGWHLLAESGAIQVLDVTTPEAWEARLDLARLLH